MVGSNYADKLDLGTLKADNSGNSSVYALNADGKVAAGWADGDAVYYRATVWRLNLTGDHVEIAKPVDVVNTQAALSQAAGSTFSTFSVLDSTEHRLHRLQNGCYRNDQGVCYAVQYDVNSTDGEHNNATGVCLGYGFGSGFSAGIALDATTHRTLPHGVSNDSGRLGLGVFARYEHALGDGNSWYLAPAVSHSSYHADFPRPQLSGTEAEVGRAKVSGQSYELLSGYQRASEGRSRVQVYGGVRHSQVKRAAYAESEDLSFPASYDAVKLRDTALVTGVSGSLPISEKLSIIGQAELEQRITGNDLNYRASIPVIGTVKHTVKVHRTRVHLAVGAQYQITPNIGVQFVPSIGTSKLGETTWGTQLRLQGKF